MYKNIKKRFHKLLVFFILSFFILGNFLKVNAQDTNKMLQSYRNVEHSTINTIKKTLIILETFRQNKSVENPQIIEERFHIIKNRCSDLLDNDFSTNNNFDKICGNGTIEGKSVIEGAYNVVINNLKEIYILPAGSNKDTIQKAINGVIRINNFFEGINETLQQDLGLLVSVNTKKAEEYSLLDFFTPTTDKESLICILSNENSGLCSDPRKFGNEKNIKHYKILFGTIFNQTFFDSGLLFIEFFNITLLNPIITIGICMYILLKVFFLFFVLGKVFDLIFIPYEGWGQKEGDIKKIKRVFLLSLLKEHNFEEIFREVIFGTGKTPIRYNYRMPSFLPLGLGGKKINYLVHLITFFVIFVLFNAFSDYLF